MPASAAALPISPSDQAVLRRWANAAQAPAALVRRAKLLLLAAELGISHSTVARVWAELTSSPGRPRRSSSPPRRLHKP
jgi:hypothetical protein